MVIINSTPSRITIRKTILSDSNAYYVIIQHDFTRIYDVLELEDISGNSSFYEFEISIPDEFPHGEYTYYIIDGSGLIDINIKCNNILQSCVRNLNVLTPIANYDVFLASFDDIIVNYEGDADNVPCERIKVLQRGIIQYFKTTPTVSYENCRQFKQYER